MNELDEIKMETDINRKVGLIVISVLISILLTKAASTKSLETHQQSLGNGETFDFIVVGGGTAGCVIAARLAESGKHTVLLIEEGGIPNPNLEVPALASYNRAILNFPNEFKFYETLPQENAGQLANGVLSYAIGKTIGGGSSVNGMMWNRGHLEDYNNWARLTNDDSWRYENLLQYFIKSENYAGFNPTIQRGYGGPITITNLNRTAPTLKEIVQAGREIGYPFGDPNGPQTESISLIDYSQSRGRRVSAFKGYIQPLLQNGAAKGQQSNLLILLNTKVKRILFKGNKAVGVTFLENNSLRTGYAKARKEIIISAGVMDSPALLMRSGIGPRDVLKRANIPVIKPLPVGKNLHDHPLFSTPFIFGNQSAVMVPQRDLTPEAWRQYQATGEGPYSIYLWMGAQGFFRSSLQKTSHKSWPDIHLIPLGMDELDSPEVADLRDGEAIVDWSHIVSRPKSRGSVTLNPENVDGPPIIDFKFFSHPDDMKVMLDAIKISEKMCERTLAMRSLGCRLPSIPLEACSHLKFRSEAYWICAIKQRTFSGIHAVGTCRMGSGPEDPEAVVDSQLKVIGFEGLSVADASVMPEVSNANTQAPVYVIAEKAAEMTLKRWEEGTAEAAYHLRKDSFSDGGEKLFLSLADLLNH